MSVRSVGQQHSCCATFGKGNGVLWTGGDGTDPFAGRGTQGGLAAIRAKPHHLAVLTAGDKALAIPTDGAAKQTVMQGVAVGSVVETDNLPGGKCKDRNIVQKCSREAMVIKVDRRDSRHEIAFLRLGRRGKSVRASRGRDHGR
jgi:hypothetical protein